MHRPETARTIAHHQVPMPYAFICTCCETVEHRRTPALPEGWETENVGHDIYAYCPQCAEDLPRRAEGGTQ